MVMAAGMLTPRPALDRWVRCLVAEGVQRLVTCPHIPAAPLRATYCEMTLPGEALAALVYDDYHGMTRRCACIVPPQHA